MVKEEWREFDGLVCRFIECHKNVSLQRLLCLLIEAWAFMKERNAEALKKSIVDINWRCFDNE